ncbi:MAG: uroporphyrinogen decarboxylase family protein, partial [Candidatus Bathyarchaeia archaeon]
MRCLNFEEPDRVATWDLINEVGIYRALGGSGPVEEVIPRTFSRLGIDATRTGLALPPTEAKTWRGNKSHYMVCEGEFTFQTVPEEGTTWIAERPFKTLEDLHEINLEPLSETEILDEFVPAVEKNLEAYRRFGVQYIFCGSVIFDQLFWYLGWPLFIKALYQARDQVRKLLDRFTFVEEVLARAWAGFDAPAYMYGDDIAYKHGLMISPEFLRDEWLPRVKRVIHPIKRRGMRALFHSDGNLWSFMDDLVNAGFEGINPLEPIAGMTVSRVKEKYGDRLVLLGGIDCSQILPLGSPQDVERTVVEAVREGAPGSGYCLGSSSEIRAGTPLVNAVTMFETARRYGQYRS